MAVEGPPRRLGQRPRGKANGSAAEHVRSDVGQTMSGDHMIWHPGAGRDLKLRDAHLEHEWLKRGSERKRGAAGRRENKAEAKAQDMRMKFARRAHQRYRTAGMDLMSSAP